MIGFICDTGIAGADINFNLVVGKRLDTFAVDGGGIEFGGGAVDGVVFVSPVGAVFVSPFVSPTNEDILLRNLVIREQKKDKNKVSQFRKKVQLKVGASAILACARMRPVSEHGTVV